MRPSRFFCSLLVTFLLLVSSGCRLTGKPIEPAATSPSSPSAAESLNTDETRVAVPPLLRVILTEVLVAPVKMDGRPWDMGSVETQEALEAIDEFASLAASSGQPVAVAVKAVSAALPALSKGSTAPDVEGEATMTPTLGGERKLNLKAHAKDDANAQFATEAGESPSWIVQTNKRPTLRVHLIDRDVMKHDAIGIFVLNGDHFEEAWRAEEKLWIRVTDQTNNQVLAVGIIVEEVR